MSVSRPLRIDVWVQTAGLGHVTRQLNLMAAVRALPMGATARIRFIVDSTASVKEMVLGQGFDVVDRGSSVSDGCAMVASMWHSEPPDAFVLDSVDHDRALPCRTLLQWPAVVSLAVIDDPRDRDVPAHIVLNALPGESTHSDERHVRGAHVIIQSPEFATYHDRERAVPDLTRKGFVFFGGADGNNMTPTFLDAIARSSTQLEWVALLGVLYSGADAAIERIERERLPVRVLRHTDSIARELWEADVAVLATGNVLSEAISVGVPTIAFAQNEIQDENARYFQPRTGFCYLGLFRDVTAAVLREAIDGIAEDARGRTEMRRRMLQTVDGGGAHRVAVRLLAALLERRS